MAKRRFGQSAKKEVDPFDHLRDVVNRYQPMYKNQYWNLMKEAVEAIDSGEVSEHLVAEVQKEHDRWGAITSNKKKLAFVLEKLKTITAA